MEEVIIYSQEFHELVEELIEILFTKEYFGFKIDCHFYAEKIYDFIDLNIDKPISKKSPRKFEKYGDNFIKYKVNHQTFRFIFFDQKENHFLVNFILNNHSNEFPELL
ncbi:MAG: hypothetical protein H7195_09805 [Chryseobacterium sp.]|nr:hypothetical protein [Chryseobacterium sp.]